MVDFFLPSDLIREILLVTPFLDIIQKSTVSKTFAHVLSDNRFWYSKLRIDFLHECLRWTNPYFHLPISQNYNSEKKASDKYYNFYQ